MCMNDSSGMFRYQYMPKALKVNVFSNRSISSSSDYFPTKFVPTKFVPDAML